ncbi:hypothetical protein [Streptomyces hainanensis]|uniref:Uncharacterized protein n=1 Tax=Streptomyces hainanensis TaxID=402648 RepID=A0A4R4TF25_9ACTN|nr:hypothetical protein [Streptomyces hainanensis]TDC73772.1 hypothetical protein E1283_18130 [Streptomyces hainanensis]
MFHDADAAVQWFAEQATRAASGFASAEEREPEQLVAKIARVEGVLRRGGDAHAAWYFQAIGYYTLDLVACSPNRNNPLLPCPAEPGSPTAVSRR